MSSTIRTVDLLQCIKKTENNSCASLVKRDGKDALHVVFPKGSAAPRGPVKGGFVAYHACQGFPARSAKIAFTVFVDDKFEWCKGGKFPWGFFLGTKGASGGRHSDTGGSIRLMWRRDGEAEVYLYFPANVKQSEALFREPGIVKDDDYGMSLWRGSFSLKKGKENSICMAAKLNEPGKENGSLSVTINGKTESFEKFVWRKDDSIKISGLFGAAFFGGSDSSWATPVNTYLDFSDIELSTTT